MTYFSSRNKVSTTNSTTTPLSAAATFTGTGAEVLDYAGVVVSVYADTACTLYFDFGPDNTNWDKTLTYSVSSSTQVTRRVSVLNRYFRVRLKNDGGNQATLRLQTLLGNFGESTVQLGDDIVEDNNTNVTRSVLSGRVGDGSYKEVPLTPEGHVEVAMHSPRLPFGSVHTERLRPLLQRDGVYGLNTVKIFASSSLSGVVTTTNSMFDVSTGITTFANAQLQSRERLRYRAGQGLVCRFAGVYDVGVTSCYLLAGMGHGEDGVYFGYVGTQFGILHSSHGIREIQTLTVNTGSTTDESLTVTLAGIGHTAAVTNSGSTLRTAYEISRGTYSGWTSHVNGSTVVFVAGSAGNKTGTFSLAGTSAAGSFVETRAGAATSDVFIPQSQWNGDRMDGSISNNPSGYVLNPTKGNVYQIGLQYLGYGSLIFDVEVTEPGNNPTFVTVHSIDIPNSRTIPSFSNPAFPITITATSAGSAVDKHVKISSFGGFVEGDVVLHGNRYSYTNNISSAGSASYQSIFSISNPTTLAGRANQSVIVLTDLSVAYKHTQPGVFALIKNGLLGGTPSFSSWAPNSCSLYDSSGTTVTVTNNDQILESISMGETGQIDKQLSTDIIGRVELQPGETITVACKTVNGTAAFAAAVLNTREDR
jgi:hypothetical protein